MDESARSGTLKFADDSSKPLLGGDAYVLGPTAQGAKLNGEHAQDKSVNPVSRHVSAPPRSSAGPYGATTSSTANFAAEHAPEGLRLPEPAMNREEGANLQRENQKEKEEEGEGRGEGGGSGKGETPIFLRLENREGRPTSLHVDSTGQKVGYSSRQPKGVEKRSKARASVEILTVADLSARDDHDLNYSDVRPVPILIDSREASGRKRWARLSLDPKAMQTESGSDASELVDDVSTPVSRTESSEEKVDSSSSFSSRKVENDQNESSLTESSLTERSPARTETERTETERTENSRAESFRARTDGSLPSLSSIASLNSFSKNERRSGRPLSQPRSSLESLPDRPRKASAHLTLNTDSVSDPLTSPSLPDERRASSQHLESSVPHTIAASSAPARHSEVLGGNRGGRGDARRAEAGILQRSRASESWKATQDSPPESRENAASSERDEDPESSDRGGSEDEESLDFEMAKARGADSSTNTNHSTKSQLSVASDDIDESFVVDPRMEIQRPKSQERSSKAKSSHAEKRDRESKVDWPSARLGPRPSDSTLGGASVSSQERAARSRMASPFPESGYSVSPEDVRHLQSFDWSLTRHEILNDLDLVANLPQRPALDYESLGPTLPPKAADAPMPTLFLDLDETLAHTSLSKNHTNPNPPNLVFSADSDSTIAHVYFRPWVLDFLQALYTYYEIVIYTASLQPYADLILDQLDRDRRVSHRLYRNHCTQYGASDIFFKDLNGTGRPLHSSVIVDNRIMSFGLNVNNGILVSSYVGQPADTELLHLIPTLIALTKQPSITRALKRLYRFEEIIAQYVHDHMPMDLEGYDDHQDGTYEGDRKAGGTSRYNNSNSPKAAGIGREDDSPATYRSRFWRRNRKLALQSTTAKIRREMDGGKILAGNNGASSLPHEDGRETRRGAQQRNGKEVGRGKDPLPVKRATQRKGDALKGKGPRKSGSNGRRRGTEARGNGLNEDSNGRNRADEAHTHVSGANSDSSGEMERMTLENGQMTITKGPASPIAERPGLLTNIRAMETNYINANADHRVNIHTLLVDKLVSLRDSERESETDSRRSSSGSRFCQERVPSIFSGSASSTGLQGTAHGETHSTVVKRGGRENNEIPNFDTERVGDERDFEVEEINQERRQSEGQVQAESLNEALEEAVNDAADEVAEALSSRKDSQSDDLLDNQSDRSVSEKLASVEIDDHNIDSEERHRQSPRGSLDSQPRSDGSPPSLQLSQALCLSPRELSALELALKPISGESLPHGLDSKALEDFPIKPMSEDPFEERVSDEETRENLRIVEASLGTEETDRETKRSDQNPLANKPVPSPSELLFEVQLGIPSALSSTDTFYETPQPEESKTKTAAVDAVPFSGAQSQVPRTDVPSVILRLNLNAPQASTTDDDRIRPIVNAQRRPNISSIDRGQAPAARRNQRPLPPPLLRPLPLQPPVPLVPAPATASHRGAAAAVWQTLDSTLSARLHETPTKVLDSVARTTIGSPRGSPLGSPLGSPRGSRLESPTGTASKLPTTYTYTPVETNWRQCVSGQTNYAQSPMNLSHFPGSASPSPNPKSRAGEALVQSEALASYDKPSRTSVAAAAAALLQAPAYRHSVPQSPESAMASTTEGVFHKMDYLFRSTHSHVLVDRQSERGVQSNPHGLANPPLRHGNDRCDFTVRGVSAMSQSPCNMLNARPERFRRWHRLGQVGGEEKLVPALNLKVAVPVESLARTARPRPLRDICIDRELHFDRYRSI